MDNNISQDELSFAKDKKVIGSKSAPWKSGSRVHKRHHITRAEDSNDSLLVDELDQGPAIPWGRSGSRSAPPWLFGGLEIWGPQLGQATYKNRQCLYLSKHVPNTLVIAKCEVVKRRVAAIEHISQFNEEAHSPFVKKYKTIIHPGEVNRIRELPQNSKIVGTHTDSPDVLIWDVEAQPNRHVILGAANSSPDLLLTGHKDNAEFPLAMCPTDPFVLFGVVFYHLNYVLYLFKFYLSGDIVVASKDKSVVLWSIQDQISTLASESTPVKSPGSGGTNTKQASKGAGNNYKLKDSPSIGPQGIYYGHEDTVEDVQFCPTSPQEFCSVGDDSCLILWDSRFGSTPVVKSSNRGSDSEKMLSLLRLAAAYNTPLTSDPPLITLITLSLRAVLITWSLVTISIKVSSEGIGLTSHSSDMPLGSPGSCLALKHVYCPLLIWDPSNTIYIPILSPIKVM
ncbi:hypothetical protein UlMin_011141 [Ulmus minor]